MSYTIPQDSDYIDLQHDQLPIILAQEIDGIEFNLSFKYNEDADIYTLEILDAQDNLILAQKVTYGKDLLAPLRNQFNISTKIIPLDVGRELQDQRAGDPRVGVENFGKAVKLVVIHG